MLYIYKLCLWFIVESALTGELKITRLSTTISDAAGNSDLFLFVEKVGKSECFFLNTLFYFSFECLNVLISAINDNTLKTVCLYTCIVGLCCIFHLNLKPL